MMTDAQKEKIRYWRMEGLGYGGIAGEEREKVLL